MIRDAAPDDAAAIAAIYNPYILDTVITFEEHPVTEQVMAERIRTINRGYPWLVFEQNGLCLGYAYASAWKDRSAYRFSCETSIYLAAQAHGQGVGTRLYEALLDDLRRRGQRTAIACIALPNPASVALHEKLGFRKVGHFAAVGIKFSRSIDVGYWQHQLNPE
ncbi:MAG: phosphinothricin acetyltransferase [Desulfuromonas sp.]|nr:MAG: phosphinothricin acetyltransferase [Desulfuromonas sp.]